ncbi:unnamed protein product [Linum tenue]|uniref:Uncharacterized protein n=1 Tax=Linum tenue TaxID=586396 RepID=A0AAV0II49_9ROSI|nr:unnamed protein product [Linum tenue]
MDHVKAAPQATLQQQTYQKLKRKIEDMDSKIAEQIKPVDDHINFTLHKAYFKCACECFETKKKGEIESCIENCAVPVLTASYLYRIETAKFQASSCSSFVLPVFFTRIDKINRYLKVCKDKYLAAMLPTAGPDDMATVESCFDGAIAKTTKWLPNVVENLKATA